MTMPHILVVGAGPVGLAFACACRGFRVTVLDHAARPVPDDTEAFDTRIFALSPGSRRFLRDIGAWDEIDSTRLAPVRRMEICGDAGAKLSFSGRPQAPLAWIVEAPRLAHALEEVAATLPDLAIRRGVDIAACEADAQHAAVTLAGGERIEGDLLVGADGADSRVRNLLGMVAEEKQYDQRAWVANFDCEKPHGDVARQWFTAEGTLAWLPLPGARISIVWSARGPLAEALGAVDDAEFTRRVQAAGHDALGQLTLASQRAGFPLRLVDVDRVAVPGVTLVGDAAHAVHPLAGQGANLGFQDARVLADELAGRSAVERVGDLRVLRRYARGRREDVSAMQTLTDRLDALFASTHPLVGDLRNAGLRMVESGSLLKGLLGDRAMR
jgi:ubiquinone biosynthesis UbiH/UbiF/VisC/COQ6 family hydroxylase